MLYLVCNGADVNTEEARKEKITALYIKLGFHGGSTGHYNMLI